MSEGNPIVVVVGTSGSSFVLLSIVSFHFVFSVSFSSSFFCVCVFSGAKFDPADKSEETKNDAVKGMIYLLESLLPQMKVSFLFPVIPFRCLSF
jgi:hypothetical protein